MVSLIGLLIDFIFPVSLLLANFYQPTHTGWLALLIGYEGARRVTFVNRYPHLNYFNWWYDSLPRWAQLVVLLIILVIISAPLPDYLPLFCSTALLLYRELGR
jgi:hypothetical protein